MRDRSPAVTPPAHSAAPISVGLYVLLAGALIVGLLLRFAMLGHGLWRDEASTYFDAFGGTWASVITRTAFSELNPPGYFLFMHGWLSLVPVSDAMMHLPSVLASWLMIFIAAAIGLRLAGPRCSVACAWIFALAPMNLYYAQEARPYMFTAACTLLALLGLVEILQNPKRKRGLLYFAIGAVGAVTTQYTGVIAIGVFLCIWGYARMRRFTTGVIAPMFAVCMLLLVVGYAMVPALMTQLHAGLSWNAPLTLKALPRLAALDLTVTLPLDWLPKHQLIKALFIVIIGAELAVTLVRRRSITLPGGRAAAYIGVALLAIALAEIPISNEGRYMVPFSGLMWILLGLWLLFGFSDTARRRQIGMYAVTGFCAVLFACDILTIREHAGTVKSAAARLSPSHALPGLVIPDWNAPGTRVLVVPDYLAATLGYYLRDSHQAFSGFARWDHPEVFSPLGYAELWRARDSVEVGLQRVAAARKNGMTKLILISHPTMNSAGLPYATGNRFVTAVRKEFPTLSHTSIAARIEPIEIDVLDTRTTLPPAPQSRPAEYNNV